MDPSQECSQEWRDMVCAAPTHNKCTQDERSSVSEDEEKTIAHLESLRLLSRRDFMPPIWKEHEWPCVHIQSEASLHVF